MLVRAQVTMALAAVGPLTVTHWPLVKWKESPYDAPPPQSCSTSSVHVLRYFSEVHTNSGHVVLRLT